MDDNGLIIIGSSGHCKVILDIVEKSNVYNIIGLIDDFRTIGEDTLGYRIIGKIEDIPELIKHYSTSNFFIAVGDNWQRELLYKKLIQLNVEIRFLTLIHPSAQIGKDVQLGEGVAMMAGSIVNPGCKIGDFGIINTGASVDHDCTIGSFASIGPKVAIGGHTTINNHAIIGIGATINDRIYIGSHTLIGSGSVVVKDIGESLVAYGVPAKEVRKREIGEKYFKPLPANNKP